MIAAFVIVGAIAAAGLIALPFYLAGRRRAGRGALPLLADVGDRSYGALSCPVCGSTSFETSSKDGRSFFGFFVFFFMFGTLYDRQAKRVECVVCTSQFLRGAPTRHFDRVV